MSQPRFEVAAGAINSVNKTFVVSTPYVPNTTAVFLNGKAYRRDWDDGWFETNPLLGIVTLKEPPIPGDVVQIFFTDAASTGALEEECIPLHGTIREIEGLRGVQIEVEARRGVISGNCTCQD